MINKILFTIFVVIAIWKGFSMLSRLAKSREEGAVQNRGNRARVAGRIFKLLSCMACAAIRAHWRRLGYAKTTPCNFDRRTGNSDHCFLQK